MCTREGGCLKEHRAVAQHQNLMLRANSARFQFQALEIGPPGGLGHPDDRVKEYIISSRPVVDEVGRRTLQHEYYQAIGPALARHLQVSKVHWQSPCEGASRAIVSVRATDSQVMNLITDPLFENIRRQWEIGA